MAAMVAAIWQRNQPQVLERLALLDEAAKALTDGALTASLRESAIATAHKLAGTLGMFGYPEGTHVARALEQQLDTEAPNPADILRLTTSLRTALFPGQSRKAEQPQDESALR